MLLRERQISYFKYYITVNTHIRLDVGVYLGGILKV